jgi:predicted permease
VTANLFGVLGLQPILGRDFAPADDRVGATPVAIIGYDLWTNRFGADPNVLGKTIRFNGVSTTIIGVMPYHMRFPENHEIWVPLTPFHLETASKGDSVVLLSVVGRLKDGASRQMAEASLSGRAAQLATEYPEPAQAPLGIRARNFSEQFIGGKADDMFTAVMGAACFVLLIACANVANLLLSRSGYRAREIAVRMTLGATRWRVVRQLLVESLLLGFLGGGLGLLLASAGVPLFEAALPQAEKPYWLVFTLDYTVVAYVAGICVVTAVIFGLVPALQVSRTDSNGALKENARGSLGNRRSPGSAGRRSTIS